MMKLIMRVVVTGASRGIGKTLAIALAKTFKQDCKLALVARSVTKTSHKELSGTLLETVKECERYGSVAIPHAVNMNDVNSYQETLISILHSFDGLDVLVNNASVLNLKDSYKSMVLNTSVNYHSTLMGIQTCIPALEVSEGSIVSVSPPIRLGRLNWISDHPSYTISKYAMSLATIQAASDKVRANCIWPKRLVQTAATKRLEHEFGIENAFTHGRKPEEFVEAIMKVIISRQYNASTLLDEDVVSMKPSCAPMDLFVEEGSLTTQPLA